MLPRNVLIALLCCLLAMQNLNVASQQLLLVLLGRIRLLRLMETLTQLLNIRRRRRRFHPYWTFPRPVESWFEIHMHQRNFPEAFFRRHLTAVNGITYAITFCVVSITKYDDPLKGSCHGTIDFLA